MRIDLRVFSQFTLQDLGNLGEFVGAIGVVVSLVYLARQMQQNTTSVRAASFNSMTENSIRLLEHALRNADFADFLHRAQQDPSTLSPSEYVRWDAYMTAVYRHFGNLIYQYRVGALDRQMWQSYRDTLKKHLRIPSWRAWFEENKEAFSRDLVDLVGKLTRELAVESRAGAAVGAGGARAGALQAGVARAGAARAEAHAAGVARAGAPRSER